MDLPPPPPQSYMRPPQPPTPPPPSMVDPHQRPPPPKQPWYSATQFHYQHHSSPSPPPPPQQQQWAPSPYPAPHPPYPAHHYPPPPPYPQVNQEWGNSNWVHHQNREYQAHNHEEDWAAKARAWAAAKAASDNQQSHPQFAPAGRPEEQSHYHDQFAQSTESHYPDMQKSPLPPSSYQQHLVPVAPQYQAPVSHFQHFASFSSGQTSYGNLAGDSAAAFPRQENSYINPSIHQQEVPSSYSSIAGNEGAGDSGKYYTSSSLPVASAPQHHAQTPLPAGARSLSMEDPQYAFGGQSTEPATSLSDQPLDFTPRFNRDHESHVQSTYSFSGGPARGVDTINSTPSNYNWAPPAVSGVVYPPMPPVLPPTSQVDPSMAIAPPVPGHSAPTFGRLPGPGFQPTASSIDAPFNVGAGPALQPAAAFPSDAFGISIVSERPKKASVPNWLREEIIKKKAVITSSTPEFPKDDNQSIEDDTIDRSYGKGEQADSRSIDSSRSTEEEDDDEDDVEAARTAAINQEIKRVLTEVLLKVTDDLFDEIATKVLSEDDLTVEDDRSTAAPNNEVQTSTRAATVKAEAKVLVPAKVKEDDSDDVNEKSTSSSPGDVLGLASYASDDDEDNKIESSANLSSKENANHLESTSSRNSAGKNLVENGVLLKETEEDRDKPASLKIDAGRKRPDVATVDHSHVVTQSSDDRPTTESVKGDELHPSKFKSLGEEKEMLDGLVASTSEETVGEKAVLKTERPGEPKSLAMDHSEGREARSHSDRSGRHETKSSVEKDYVKEEESRKDKVYEKGDETHRRHDGKHVRKEKVDDQNVLKDKAKGKGIRTGDKTKDSDSRKRASPSDVKESKREKEKERKADREDNVRKKERKDDKKEKSRHKNASDSSRHKSRRRSLSVDSRGRESKDSSVFSHANDANDESSDDSRRKRQSRRHESPSPVRSKRRHVSRSPHTKHSQRRHSPYSSLDTTRGKRSRSRSRSPVRRKR